MTAKKIGFSSKPRQPRDVEAQLERDLAAPLLKQVLITIVVAGLALSAASAAGSFTKTLLLAIGNTAVAAAMLAAARRGYSLLASVVVTLALAVTTGYAMMTGVGLFDDALLIVPGVFMMASLLLSPAWLRFVIGVTMAAIIVTGVAQVNGYIVPTSSRARYQDIIEIVVLLGGLAAFFHYLVSMLRRIVIESRLAHQSVQDILDATSEAIFIHDARDGRIVSVNKPTLEMFGVSREEFLGQSPSEMTGASPDHDGRAASEYLRRATTEGPQSFEWLARRKDGTTFWAEVALRYARIAEEPRVVAVVRDISARRKLEQRVREAETFRAVGQLAGGVAHDFNNQLVGILGHAEFLQEALESRAELRDCADSILTSGRRAAELTRQLLAFARRGRRCNLPVDLHQLIAEVIALGRRSIDKRISIEQQLDASPANTLGDPSALQNALLNLLLNARDAMPKGGTLRFATKLVEAQPASARSTIADWPARFIELKVSDTGIGIDPDNLVKVFEPFFTTKESGTGMGLAAVQGTVFEHQGTIEVDSTIGVGTTFRLMLPLRDIGPLQEAEGAAAVSTAASGKILVVDDEASVVAVVKMTLMRGGYDVETCQNGLGALERYSMSTFDLVLLDVMMPDLDGVEVLRRIRAQAPNAKVMLMTGHAGESIEARMSEFPDVVVLPKPFQPKQLIEEIRKVLAE